MPVKSLVVFKEMVVASFISSLKGAHGRQSGAMHSCTGNVLLADAMCIFRHRMCACAMQQMVRTVYCVRQAAYSVSLCFTGPLAGSSPPYHRRCMAGPRA